MTRSNRVRVSRMSSASGLLLMPSDRTALCAGSEVRDEPLASVPSVPARVLVAGSGRRSARRVARRRFDMGSHCLHSCDPAMLIFRQVFHHD